MSDSTTLVVVFTLIISNVMVSMHNLLLVASF